MKIPFSTEQFFEVFRNYNETVFPTHILLYLISFISIFELMKPSCNTSKIISGLLASLWLWMGIVYHLVFFTSINPAAYVFGFSFIAEGILFLALGVFSQKHGCVGTY